MEGVMMSPASCPDSSQARTSGREMTRSPPSTSGGDEVTTAMRAMRLDPVVAAGRAGGRIQHASRNPDRPRAGRNVAEHDGARAYDRPVADRHAIEHLRARANPHALTHSDTGGFAWLRVDRHRWIAEIVIAAN